MNTKQNDYTFPFQNSSMVQFGLTKREYFSAMAMQGFIAAEADNEDDLIWSEVVKKSVSIADFLIDELNKEK